MARWRWRTANAQKRGDTEKLWDSLQAINKETKNAYNADYVRGRRKWRDRVTQEGGLSSRTLWASMKHRSTGVKGVQTANGIVTSEQEIKEAVKVHFQELGAESGDEGPPPSPDAGTGATEGIMQPPISFEEVNRIARSLKNGKTAGEDGICNELIKYGGRPLHEALAKVFDIMRKIGVTPKSWNKEAVRMIHKAGKKTDLNNYRGIAVSTNIGKVFTRIMAERITTRAEEEGWLPEAQAGFRKERGTDDHLFVLNMIMERAKANGQGLLLGFIDLKKAYDTVSRKLLWSKLREMGMDGHTITLLKGLYNDHFRRIQVAGGHTDWMECLRGLRQGCPLSPILFALFIAWFPEQLTKTCEGIRVGDAKICSLFFADDIILIARTEKDLQHQLSQLQEMVGRSKLDINVSKSMIMRVSHSKADTSDSPEWQLHRLGDKPGYCIKEGNEYKYLGIKIGKSSGFKVFRNEKIKKTRMKVACVKVHARRSLDRLRTAIAFWKMAVRSEALSGGAIVLYPKTWLKEMENIQSRMAKWLVGASRSGSTAGIRGDLGWSSIKAEIAKMKLRWWAKVIRMGQDRWPKKALMEMWRQPRGHKWVQEVEKLCAEYQVSSADTNTKGYKTRIRSRVEDKDWAEWRERASNSSRLKHGVSFSPGAQAKYLSNSKASHAFCKARIGDTFRITGKMQCDYCPIL
jgi:hypothetical protein